MIAADRDGDWQRLLGSANNEEEARSKFWAPQGAERRPAPARPGRRGTRRNPYSFDSGWCAREARRGLAEHRPKWRILMRSLAKKVHRFLVSEDGPTAVEYAVMLALIIIVCLTAITQLGQQVNTTFTNIKSAIPSGSAPSGS
jgi:pilus assembly protein Flp/PilA